VRSLVARARRKLTPLLAEYAPDAAPYVNEVFEEQPVTEHSQDSLPARGQRHVHDDDN
jgi:hypothetical protein